MPPGLNPGSLAGTCSGWADGSADEACHTSAHTTTRAQGHTSHVSRGPWVNAYSYYLSRVVAGSRRSPLFQAVQELGAKKGR